VRFQVRAALALSRRIFRPLIFRIPKDRINWTTSWFLMALLTLGLAVVFDEIVI